jgi:hypothetical protein
MPVNGNGVGWKVIGPSVVGILLTIIGYIAVKNLSEVDRIGRTQAERGQELHYIWEELKHVNERLDRIERR